LFSDEHHGIFDAILPFDSPYKEGLLLTEASTVWINANMDEHHYTMYSDGIKLPDLCTRIVRYTNVVFEKPLGIISLKLQEGLVQQAPL
jgi:hypothetical protein